MKKLFIIVSAAVMATSCGNNQQKQREATQAAAAQVKQTTIDSVNTANQQQKTIDSLKLEVAATKEKEASANTQAAQPLVTTTSHEKNKGWNNTTKGAVIGAGAGAVTGAMVAKHKGAGAVVGGLIGAGAGAGTGAIIDNSKKKKQ